MSRINLAAVRGELAGLYATPLPQLAEDVAMLAARVGASWK